MSGAERRRVLLLLTGFGGLLFIAVFATLGWVTPAYNPVRDTISALEATPLGWAQQANFIVFGMLLCLFAWALRRELQSGWGARAIPALQALAGLGVIGDGIFLWPTAAHMVCAEIAFNAALCVLITFAWRVRRDRCWEGWAMGSSLAAVAMTACLFCFGMMNHLGGPAGLMEKSATVVRTVWAVALTSRLLLGASLAPASEPVVAAP